MLIGALQFTMYGLDSASAVLEVAVLPPLRLSSTIAFPCLLSAVLVTYAVDGPRATRLLIGQFVILALLFPAIQAMVRAVLQAGAAAAPPVLAEMVATRLRLQAASAAAFAIDLFAVVIISEGLLRAAPRVPRSARTTAAMGAVLALDSIVFTTLAFAGRPGFVPELAGQLAIRPAVALLVGPLVALYLRRAAPGAEEVPRGMLDILRRVGALEESLRRAREREELFQRFFEIAPDGMILAGPDGRILEANAAAARLTGIPLDRLRGALFEDLLRERCGEKGAAALRECRASGHAAVDLCVTRAAREGGAAREERRDLLACRGWATACSRS